MTDDKQKRLDELVNDYHWCNAAVKDLKKVAAVLMRIETHLGKLSKRGKKMPAAGVESIQLPREMLGRVKGALEDILGHLNKDQARLLAQ